MSWCPGAYNVKELDPEEEAAFWKEEEDFTPESRYDTAVRAKKQREAQVGTVTLATVLMSPSCKHIERVYSYMCKLVLPSCSHATTCD